MLGSPTPDIARLTDPGPPAKPPVMSSERILLRPILQQDYEFLYFLELGRPEAVFFRHRGRSIAPEQFPSTLWSGVLVQSVVCERASGRPIGLQTCFDADFRNGHARLATILDPEYLGLGWPLESSEIFIDYIFATFPFRKLYGDILEFNSDALHSSLPDLARVEGRLHEHEYYGGRYWDLVTIAIYRREWEERNRGNDRRARFMDALRESDV